MSTQTDTLQVQLRESRGTSHARRMRRRGQIPAVLYGLGKDTVALTVSADQFTASLRHGARVVKLTGAVSDEVLIREVQWDHYGADVLHIDFGRFAVGDRVQAAIPLELRGEAPGTHEGGSVQLLLHELEIECAVVALPELIQININQLQLGDTIHAEDLDLPEGATLVHGNELVVTCEAVVEQAEDEEQEGVSAEPEVIGRSAADEEAEEG